MIDESKSPRVGARAEFLELASLIVIAISGAAVLMLLPIIISAVSSSHGFSAKQLGIFGGADLLAAALAALLIGRSIQKSSWRMLVTVAASVIVLANLVSAMIGEFYFTVAVRLIAGAAAGVLLSVGTTGLATSRKPDRNIAIYLVSALLLGAIGIQLFAKLSSSSGTPAVFVALAAFSSLGFLAVRWIPARLPSVDSVASDSSAGGRMSVSDPKQNRAAMFGVLGVLLYFSALGLIWGNMALLGALAAVDRSTIEIALSLSLVFGMLGGLSAMFLATRFGRLFPVMLSISASIIALGFMFDLTGTVFLVASAILIFGWNFTIPYEIAAIALADTSGSFVSKCVSMQLLGFSIGPVIAGFLLEKPKGYVMLLVLAMFGFFVAAALFYPVLHRNNAAQSTDL
jgi:predicted MFS family arabinose efflux permease